MNNGEVPLQYLGDEQCSSANVQCYNSLLFGTECGIIHVL